MVDPISVGAIVISSLTAFGGVIAGIHIKRMHSGCCECECFDTGRKTVSPPSSPIIKTEPVKNSSIV